MNQTQLENFPYPGKCKVIQTYVNCKKNWQKDNWMSSTLMNFSSNLNESKMGSNERNWCKCNLYQVWVDFKDIFIMPELVNKVEWLICLQASMCRSLFNITIFTRGFEILEFIKTKNRTPKKCFESVFTFRQINVDYCSFWPFLDENY